MVAPIQLQHSHLGTQVKLGHMSNAQLVVEIITSGRTVNRIISEPGVGQDHMLHTCAEHLQTKVGTIIFVLYCGSTHQTSSNCTSQPNDNREEPRSSPRDLHSQGPYYRANTKYLGVP